MHISPFTLVPTFLHSYLPACHLLRICILPCFMPNWPERHVWCSIKFFVFLGHLQSFLARICVFVCVCVCMCMCLCVCQAVPRPSRASPPAPGLRRWPAANSWPAPAQSLPVLLSAEPPRAPAHTPRPTRPPAPWQEAAPPCRGQREGLQWGRLGEGAGQGAVCHPWYF